MFRGTPPEVARQYRILAMGWHPDRPEKQGSCEACEVFTVVAEQKSATDVSQSRPPIGREVSTEGGKSGAVVSPPL